MLTNQPHDQPTGRNILVFADGTGQAGGLVPDEVRTNVYKLFRATRCGPDTCIPADRQISFYDPGIGSAAVNSGVRIGFARSVINVVCQATGLGITKNIVYCYAALIQLWRPGDRIYLFGFSRGAYTVRCLAGVLKFCGVPTLDPKTGEPLALDPASVDAVARDAVMNVYQHAASTATKRFIDQRKVLAERFRTQHGSGDVETSNANPHFVGVFDTVAALGTPWWMQSALYIVSAAAYYVLTPPVSRLIGHILPSWRPFGTTLATDFYVLVACALLLWYLRFLLKVSFRAGCNAFRTLHLLKWHPGAHEDEDLSSHVTYARHAMSIDEARRAFKRVGWIPDAKEAVRDDQGNIRFEQIWFAGNHADVGGGYPEAESRLSDVALKWISDEARRLPSPILVDPTLLQLSPAFDGPAHDEVARGVGGFRRLPWPREARTVKRCALLHPSVFRRLAAEEVRGFGGYAKYEPAPLGEPASYREYRPVVFSPGNEDGRSNPEAFHLPSEGEEMR